MPFLPMKRWDGLGFVLRFSPKHEFGGEIGDGRSCHHLFVVLHVPTCCEAAVPSCQPMNGESVFCFWDADHFFLRRRTTMVGSRYYKYEQSTCHGVINLLHSVHH